MKKFLVLIACLLTGIWQPCLAVFTAGNSVCTGSTDAGNNVTTSAIDTTGADLLFLVSSTIGAAPDGTITDSKNNRWIALTRYGGFQSGVTIFYSTGAIGATTGPTVGTNHTFTESSGITIYMTICVLAVSGETTTFVPLDTVNGNAVTAVSSVQPGSVTPSENSVILISSLGQCAALSGATHSINSSFIVAADEPLVGGQHCAGAIAYKIKSDLNAENPTWSWTGTDDASSGIAGFKDLAAGGGVVAPVVVPRKGGKSRRGIFGR